jgi:hypothetical protein
VLNPPEIAIRSLRRKDNSTEDVITPFNYSGWDSSFRGGMDRLPDSGRATPWKPKEPVSQHNFMDGCQKSQNQPVWRKEEQKEIGEGTSLPFLEQFGLRREDIVALKCESLLSIYLHPPFQFCESQTDFP